MLKVICDVSVTMSYSSVLLAAPLICSTSVQTLSALNDELFKVTKIWADEYFGPTNILGRRIFWADEYFGPTNILGRRIFWADEYFGPTNILGRRIFWADEYFGPTNILGRRIFWADNFLGPFNLLRSTLNK